MLKKQGRLTAAERANDRIGDQYLFVALDEETKLVPAFTLGKRTGETTEAVHRRPREPTDAGRTVPAGPRPQLSTDGWRSYRPAIEDAFGERADYGVIIKTFVESEQPGRYGPPELADTDRRVIVGPIDPFTICTSHVERHNLSIRTFLRRFTRLALGLLQEVRMPASGNCPLHCPLQFLPDARSLPGTPAMAARLTGHPWSMEELLEEAE